MLFLVVAARGEGFGLDLVVRGMLVGVVLGGEGVGVGFGGGGVVVGFLASGFWKMVWVCVFLRVLGRCDSRSGVAGLLVVVTGFCLSGILALAMLR